MEKPIIIIQASRERTGSTFLTNMLYGFIIPNERVTFYNHNNDITRRTVAQSTVNVNQLRDFNVYVYKSHNLNFDDIMDSLSNTHEIYFACSERNNAVIEPKYRSMKNVIIFDYDTELLENHHNTIEILVNNAHVKLAASLPKRVILSKDSAVKRLNDMNARYEEIKFKDFSFVDTFYELHGSHRNRNEIPAIEVPYSVPIRYTTIIRPSIPKTGIKK